MTVNGYDVVRMVRNLREPDVTPKTAARAADLMDELAEELAGTREELGDLNSLLDAVLADGPPPGWRGHTDRLEVANPVARWLSLDPELVRLAARVGGAL